MADQSHPLYATDREIIDRLLAVQTPADQHLVDAARLLNRYQGFPGASDLKQDLQQLLSHWHFTRAQLNERVRAIWAAGFRPGEPSPQDVVGSGFDTASNDSI